MIRCAQVIDIPLPTSATGYKKNGWKQKNKTLMYKYCLLKDVKWSKLQQQYVYITTESEMKYHEEKDNNVTRKKK